MKILVELGGFERFGKVSSGQVYDNHEDVKVESHGVVPI